MDRELLMGPARCGFSPVDIHFALFMERLSGARSDALVMAALLASSRTGTGDICVDLPALSGMPLMGRHGNGEGQMPGAGSSLTLPAPDEWVDSLRGCGIVGTQGEYRPLILDEKGRLYLYRYWEYEKCLAGEILGRMHGDPGPCDAGVLKDGMRRLFGNAGGEGFDWQAVAALSAVRHSLCVLSGGPGTGKTSTVVNMLVLLIEQALAQNRVPSIAMAAPTGKAAARLREAVRRARDGLRCDARVRSLVPDEAHTLQRLLGAAAGRSLFRHHAGNPLPYDIVVVDEASMADLALMAKFMDAVPRGSKIIIIGDRDQLASVEAGAVLGDICSAASRFSYSAEFTEYVRAAADIDIKPGSGGGTAQARMRDCVINLEKSYRFGEDSGIGHLGRAVKSGSAGDVVHILIEGGYGDILFKDCGPDSFRGGEFVRKALDAYSPRFIASSPAEYLNAMPEFMILSPLRSGPCGVDGINDEIEKALYKNGLIKSRDRWYSGKPLLITKNDYSVLLFNGDMGVLFDDGAGSVRAHFQSADGSIRAVAPARLPSCEAAYALTVHKSQGSEFERVLLLLPDLQNSEGLRSLATRELLYTAITRARRSVEIWGRAETVSLMASNPTVRTSGLMDRLLDGCHVSNERP
jgi:exodeoxyribonuclease V alpha subunit